MVKSRKSKETSANDASKSGILGLLAQAKEASKASNSEVAMFAVIFPLIANYLKEDPELLYKVIPVS